MTEQKIQCQECSALMDENKGRMVILDQESPTAEGGGEKPFTDPSSVFSVSKTSGRED